jgi:hypothetical protein
MDPQDFGRSEMLATWAFMIVTVGAALAVGLFLNRNNRHRR